MPLNTLATAKRYTGELDKMLIQKSVTGFMADNIFRAKFVGAKTVIVPDIDFVGLADYDRDNGFSKAGTTVTQTSFELAKDRARKIMIDREDMDETGIANLSGQVLGEYIRTKVVPEMDAYVLSKLYGVAKQKSNTNTYTEATVFADFIDAVNAVHDAAGFDEELVAFVDSTEYAALMKSTEFTKNVIVSDFKQGEINLKVKKINDVAIIPVSSERMRGSYTFNAGATATAGGFTPEEEADYVRCLILPKKAASLVKKTETMRIFTPEQNKDADAYEFNYRLYYDVFVKKSNLETIYAISEAAE